MPFRIIFEALEQVGKGLAGRRVRRSSSSCCCMHAKVLSNLVSHLQSLDLQIPNCLAPKMEGLDYVSLDNASNAIHASNFLHLSIIVRHSFPA
jgi:hypothetical protein